jgi:hypothetical protein
MDSRGRLTFHTQLILPAIPIAFDTCIRIFCLAGVVNIFKIPDLVALLATNAFFALNISLAIRPQALPGDPEIAENAELARTQLMGIVATSFMLVGIESIVRAVSDSKGPNWIDWREGALTTVIVIFVALSIRIILKRHISWTSR